MAKFFLHIYDFLAKRRGLMWALLLGTVAAFVAGSLFVTTQEDVADFLPADRQNRDVYWAFSHVGDANKVVITLSGGEDKYELMDAVDTLEIHIRREIPEEYYSNLTARVDEESTARVTDFLVGNLPYYLADADYARLDSLMASGSLERELAAVKSLVSSPAGSFFTGIVPSDPLRLSLAKLRGLNDFRTTDAIQADDDYIFTADGDALVTLTLCFGGGDTGRASRFIHSLDKAMRDTEKAFDKRISIDSLGSVYIGYSNSTQIKEDSILSVLISVVLIALLLISFFRKGRSIVFIAITLTYGFLLALCCTSLIMGSLSLIVIGVGSVIIGITANYPLHYLTHVQQGYSPRESLSDIVLPLTTGNITTVGAFLSLLFIASPAMRCLGLFAALLLVGTILFSLIFLPHLVPAQAGNARPMKAWDALSGMRLGTNRWALLVVLALTVVFAFFMGRVRFDSDLAHINYMTERQRANIGRMLSLAQGNTYISYVAVLGGDVDEALARYEAVAPKIDSLSSVLPEGSRVSALHDYVPAKALQEERLAKWDAFTAVNGERLVALLDEAAASQGFTAQAFDPFKALLAKDFRVEDASYFNPFTDNVAPGYIVSDGDRAAVFSLVGTSEKETARIESVLGDPSTYVVFDSSTMTERMVSSLSEEFDLVLYVCAFIVFLLLILSFGRLELAGIAFLPLTVGWIWILGLMGWTGIDFNIVNIILATFIFGMGDDYTIFIVEGLIYEYAYGRKMLRTYERTIALSALIMFVGIGALIVAEHPAMRSLAYVVFIGMFCVVLMADILPPFLYRWITMKHGRKRKYPLTIRNWMATFGAFIVFLVGALIITIGGFFLITCTFGSRKGKYLYHCLLQGISGFVFRNAFYTTHTIDRGGEKFDKPAVIVANHQSHLDLMALLQLTPRMVVITNKAVWNNPLYGLVIRYADFCPVDDGMTGDLSKVEKMVADGYSVLVFPEGTRTMDGSIGRFHRGAFYMAEQFGLDIVPIVLHGVNDVLPKEDLLLRKGHMTVRVLPRIPAGDPSWGVDYRERSKTVRHAIMEAFGAIARDVETVDYFADRVKYNYIYKGAEVERSVRRALRRNANYRELAAALPEEGHVLFVNPGYGEAAMICALVKKRLEIDVLMEDPMTEALASGCAGLPANVHYVSQRDLRDDYTCRVVFEAGVAQVEKPV